MILISTILKFSALILLQLNCLMIMICKQFAPNVLTGRLIIFNLDSDWFILLRLLISGFSLNVLVS